MTERESAQSALNYLDSGCSREEWVRIGMAVKSAGLDFDDFHDWSKHAGNYKSEKDCRTVWESFKETGSITIATLFHMAHEKGWVGSVKKNNNPNKKKSLQVHNQPSTNSHALRIWEICQPALPCHEYILRKQGKPDGLKTYPSSASPLIINNQNVAGYLVIPCLSDEKLQTLHFIPPGKGDKLHLPGANFNDGFFVVGKINETTKSIYICEGIGHAWAINEATKASAVVCFGASRMPSSA